MCARPAQVAESSPLARLQVLQNSGSWIFILRIKTLSLEITTDEIQENYREHSNIKGHMSAH